MPTRAPVHRPAYLKPSDSLRPSAVRRGYGRAWQKARVGWLAKHPFCVMCAALGKTVLARQVDHREPHRGDMNIFWDKSKWQSLCDPHSNAKSRSEMLTTPLKG